MDIMEFKILNTAIERVLNQEMAELGITYTQATVIGYLHRNCDQEVCQKDIEHGLGLTHPTMSSILNRLEEKGLVATEPLESDRRYKKIVLTSRSESLVYSIRKKTGRIQERLFSGMSEKEIGTLSGMIDRLIRNMT